MSGPITFFSGVACFVYAYIVFMEYCLDKNDQPNFVLRLASASIWPIRLCVFVVRSIGRGARRLFVDACALIPRQKEVKAPPCVTVEMLATESEPQYRAGQWMQ